MIRYHISDDANGSSVDSYVAVGDNEAGSFDCLIYGDGIIQIDRKRPEFTSFDAVRAHIECMTILLQGYAAVRKLAQESTTGNLFEYDADTTQST